jgi:mannosyl-3-phosphoglycerate phosphatase family protein
MKSAVIFTDLDGTLLDHETYTFEPALQALRLIRESGIPLVLCSSKTRGEIERYRWKLDNRHPFISENGGGIFIPAGYFDPLPLPSGSSTISSDGYTVIRLGAPYPALRRALAELRSEGFTLTGFGDMTTAEVSAITGLTMEEAALAMEREFDEPFIFKGDDESAGRLQMAVRAKGFHLTMGRFFHIIGDSDKGKAFDIIAGFYRKKLGGICTIALGDSPNDIPMLAKADCAVLVKKPGGEYDRRIDLPNLVRADGIGPAGWNAALHAILKKM